MTQLVIPNTIDAGSVISALEHQQNYEAIRNIINGQIDDVNLAQVPQVRVTNSAVQAIPHNVTTPITFDTERYDIGGLHDVVTNTNRLTASKAGLWTYGASLSFAPNATGTRQLSIRNGATIVALADPANVPSGSVATALFLAGEIRLAAGDWLEVRAFQTSGAPLNTVVGAPHMYSPEFWMSWKSN